MEQREREAFVVAGPAWGFENAGDFWDEGRQFFSDAGIQWAWQGWQARASSTTAQNADSSHQGIADGKPSMVPLSMSQFASTADYEAALVAQSPLPKWAHQVFEILRGYPDFDEGGPLADMLDQALRGERPSMLDDIDALANGFTPVDQLAGMQKQDDPKVSPERSPSGEAVAWLNRQDNDNWIPGQYKWADDSIPLVAAIPQAARQTRVDEHNKFRAWALAENKPEKYYSLLWDGWIARARYESAELPETDSDYSVAAVPSESPTAREVKNQLCIDGTLNKALDDMLANDGVAGSIDAMFNILSALAHDAVDRAFAAMANDSAEDRQPNGKDGS